MITRSLRCYSRLLFKSPSSPPIKENVHKLSKAVVSAIAIAVLAGSLTPISAQAVTPTQESSFQFGSSTVKSNEAIDTAPVSLNVTKSGIGDLGMQTQPFFTISKKFGSNLDDPNEFYSVSVYDVDTGEFIGKGHFNSEGNARIDLKKFVDYGVHSYRALVTGYRSYGHETDNIEDFQGAVGKSEIIKWERSNRFTIGLNYENKNQAGEGGAEWKYSLNQEINESTHKVYLFNMTTGRLVSQYGQTNKKGSLGYVPPPLANKTNQYKAVLIDGRIVDEYFQRNGNYALPYSEIGSNAAAISNLVSYERDSWSVNVIFKEINGIATDKLEVQITKGGGWFRAYLVEDSTGKVIWNDETGYGAEPYDGVQDNGNISNEGHPDTSWVTAYIAPDPWNNFNGEAHPMFLKDIKGIIASSKGLIDAPSGIQSPAETTGGSPKSEAYCGPCHGDPITTSTGEFYETQTDIISVGSGLVPQVERTFSTFNKDAIRSLSTGWRTNYDMKLTPGGDPASSNYDPNILTTNTLQIENENSSLTSFYKNAEGKFQGKSDTLATLEFDPTTNTFKYARHVKSRETFIFDASGKLLEVLNDVGQKVSLSYDTNAKITTASDAIGNTLTFTYNADGNLANVTAQNGQSAVYTYNSQKQLINVTNYKGVDLSYTYDSLNRISTFKNQLGGTFTNTYDNSDRVTEQVDPLGRNFTFSYVGDFKNGVTTIIYPNGKNIVETYERGRIVKKVENSSSDAALTWHYSYDSTGNISSTTNPDGTSTSSIFDSRGNLIESIDGNNNSTFFTYDSSDNLIKVVDMLGGETNNVYDDKNNLISTTTPLGEKTTFTYTNNNQVASATDPRGNILGSNPSDFTSAFTYLPNRMISSSENALLGKTKLGYDTRGNVSSTENPLGSVSEIFYNALGLPERIIDPLSNETAMTYDKMGNVLTSKNANGAITTYTYDLLGNMLTSTNALNEPITFTYDSMNKPISITLPDNSVQTITYDVFSRPTNVIDSLGRVKKQEWDNDSNLVASIDADGGRTEYFYNDRNGNLTSTKSPVGDITRYFYDKLDQLIAVVDPLNRVTQTIYDANGRVIETIAADNTTVKTVYDSVGNVVKTTNEEGISKLYTYDSLNRKVSYINETGQITTYTYDANSNLMSQVRPDGSIVSYTYDARNLLTQIDYPGESEDVVYVYDSIGRKVSEVKGIQDPKVYTYDALNRITSQGKPGSVVSYTYDVVGSLTKMTYPSGRTVDYSYDSVGQATQLDTAGIAGMTFGYNSRGLETSAKLPSGVTESKSYDAASRLTGSELTNSAAESIYKRTQQYNSANEVHQKGVYSNGETISLENFIYDPTSKLTAQKNDTTGDTVNGYSYSIAGNLSSINSSAQTHDDSGKIVSSGDGSISYDGRNNRVTAVDATDTNKNVEYVWAQNNLLKEVSTHKDGTPNVTMYEYSSDNLLEERKQGASTDKFIWDTNRAIPVMLSDGKFEYLYKNSTARTPFAQVDISTQEVSYLHNDLTGSVVAKTNSSGDLLGKTDYSPYGEPTGSVLSRFGYTGEWTDETTGYSFLRNRWLDVKTGSFLSEDPMVQMTQNAFGYTEGNPLTQIDPLGLWTDDLISIPIGSGLKSHERRMEEVHFIRQNSGYISGAFSLAAVIAAETVVGLPFAPILGAVGFVFGVVSTDYELANCDGRLNDKNCDPASLGLGIISAGTGGLGGLAGKMGKSFNARTNLNNASFVSGFVAMPVGFIVSTLNPQKDEPQKVDKKEVSCE